MYFFLDKRVRHKHWRAFVKAERRRKRRRLLASAKSLKEERQIADLLSDPAYRARIEEQSRLEEEACRLEEVTARRRREEWIAKDLALHSMWLKNKEKDRRLLEDQQRKEDLLKQEWEAGVRKEEEQKTKKQEQQVRQSHREERAFSFPLDFICRKPFCEMPPVTLEGRLPATPIRPLDIRGHVEREKLKPVRSSIKLEPADLEQIVQENTNTREPLGPSSWRTCTRTSVCKESLPTITIWIWLSNIQSPIGTNTLGKKKREKSRPYYYHHLDLDLQWKDFYFDVLPEFEKCGLVIQFKVCCNKSPHLRGNVYVQFDEVKAAEDAVRRFNGRWYAGKQISCIFIPIERWKAAICGLYWNRKCPKGDLCNFLHVFKNPDNAFHGADRDYHLTRKDTRDESGGNSSRRSREEEEDSRRHRSRNRRKSSDSHRSYVSERSSRSERDHERSTSSRRSHNQSSERERSRSSRKRSRDRGDKRSRESYRSSSSEMNKENKKERSGKSKREN